VIVGAASGPIHPSLAPSRQGRMFRFPRRVRHAALLLGAAVLAVACVDGTTGPTSPTTSTSAAVLAAMTAGLQDEYRAAAVYESVLGQFGDVLPFSNIVIAERQHAASIAALFIARGLAVPAPTTIGALPSLGTVRDACDLGATAEVENVALYDDLLALDLPFDVQRVFEANRLASLEKHLPAFERCGPLAVGLR